MTPEEQQQLQVQIRNRLDQQAAGGVPTTSATTTTVKMSPEETQQLQVQIRNRMEQQRLESERVQREVGGRVADQNDSPAWKEIKTLGSIARGTGEGFARLGDMPRQGLKYVGEWARKGVASALGNDYERQPVGSPLRDAYNELMPAAPSGYENVNDVSSVVGPLVVGTIASGGFATPEIAASSPELVQMGAGLVRGGLNAATDFGAGYAGAKGTRAAVNQFTDNPEALDVAENIGGFVGPAVKTRVTPVAAQKVFLPQGRPTTLRDVGLSLVAPGGSAGLGLPAGVTKAAGVVPLITGARYARDLMFSNTPQGRWNAYRIGMNPPPDPATLGGVLSSAATGGGANQILKDKPLVQPPPISGPNGWLSNFGVN